MRLQYSIYPLLYLIHAQSSLRFRWSPWNLRPLIKLKLENRVKKGGVTLLTILTRETLLKSTISRRILNSLRRSWRCTWLRRNRRRKNGRHLSRRSVFLRESTREAAPQRRENDRRALTVTVGPRKLQQDRKRRREGTVIYLWAPSKFQVVRQKI